MFTIYYDEKLEKEKKERREREERELEERLFEMDLKSRDGLTEEELIDKLNSKIGVGFQEEILDCGMIWTREVPLWPDIESLNLRQEIWSLDEGTWSCKISLEYDCILASKEGLESLSKAITSLRRITKSVREKLIKTLQSSL